MQPPPHGPGGTVREIAPIAFGLWRIEPRSAQPRTSPHPVAPKGTPSLVAGIMQTMQALQAQTRCARSSRHPLVCV